MNATYHGGRVLVDPTAYLVFWGSFWRSDKGLLQLVEVIEKAQEVMAGPFVSSLDQYGVREATFGDWVNTLAADPQDGVFQDEDTANLISQLVDEGVLPPWDDNNGENIYCVVLPPGSVNGADPTRIAAHETNDKSVPAYVVAQDADTFTAFFSHELAEAAVNPSGDGWFEDIEDPEDEICDVCNFDGVAPAMVDGIAYSRYRSNWDRECLAPLEPGPNNLPFTLVGTPCAVTSNHAGYDEVFVFVRSDSEHLLMCYWNANPRITSWEWQDLSNDDGGAVRFDGVASSPNAVSSVQYANNGERALHAFVQGDDGHLHERAWVGARWANWADHDQPVWNVAVALRPAATPFRVPGSLTDMLQVFVWGDDERLYRYTMDVAGGVVRHFQGNLPDNQAWVVSEPAALTAPAVGYFYGVYAFVVASNGKLYANFSTDQNGQQWAWRDLGLPDRNAEPPVTALGGVLKPAVIWFAGRAQCFVCCSDDELWVCSWVKPVAGGPEVEPVWTRLGLPDGANSVASGPSAVIYHFDDTDFCYTFLQTDNRHLAQCRWDGQNAPLWGDFGRPTTGGDDVPAAADGGNVDIVGAPSAVTYAWDTGPRIYVFVVGEDGHLHVCYWNGDTWLWTDLGSPSPF